MDGMVGDRQTFTIGDRLVGTGCPCFVIAEAGVNHNGSLDMALQLVDAAASAGADAVKFQTFRADQIVSPDAPKARYQMRAPGDTESQHDMLRRLELAPTAYRALAQRCAEKRLIFLSTPFDEESADLLEAIGVPAFKAPSGELTNLSFLRYLAHKGRPLIISTGMATLDDVRAAVDVVRGAGCHEFLLLHCVSNYPADPADVNLRAMESMATAFGVPVGYSDHTLGNEVPFAAVALGACVIEKHMTLDRSLHGPDHRASAEPRELASLVAGIRGIEAAIGDGEKRPAASEIGTARVARRSLVAARAIPAGATLTAEMVVSRRPGTGMAPGRLGEVLRRRTLADIAAGTMLAPEMFE
jgi:N,N'-diacetyllegionaminate synthase